MLQMPPEAFIVLGTQNMGLCLPTEMVLEGG